MFQNVSKYLYRGKKWFHDIRLQNNELLWTAVYHDTKQGIPWMVGLPSISPGRWAVGYNYLYVMSRILNDIHPKSILEFGLGVSTSLISAYVKYFEDIAVRHMVIEHDNDWIRFYTNSHEMSKHTKVLLHEIEWCDDFQDYARYKDLQKSIGSKKFEVISIDAPFGTTRGGISNRADIIEFLPDILERDFAIVYDDANREGEKNTISKICDILQSSGIEYMVKSYEGISDCVVIASKGYKFLCSL